MPEQIRHSFPTPLDIRAAFALAKVYRRFALGEHHRMIGEAMTDAEQYAFRTLAEPDGDGACPTLFADEPELVASWETGAAEYRRHFLERFHARNHQAALDAEERAEAERDAARLAALRTYPFPTGAELLADLQAGKPTKLNQNSLHYREDEGIWVTNAYGIDCLLLEPTAEACQSFIDAVRAGDEFGPSPD